MTKYIDIKWEDHYDQLPKNYIHSDLTRKNILFDKDLGVSGLIDFESTKFGPRIWDIARIPVEFIDTKSELLEFISNYSKNNSLLSVEIDYLYNWIHALNIGVTYWSITHYFKNIQTLSKQNKNYLKQRIFRAINVSEIII